MLFYLLLIIQNIDEPHCKLFFICSFQPIYLQYDSQVVIHRCSCWNHLPSYCHSLFDFQSVISVRLYMIFHRKGQSKSFFPCIFLFPCLISNNNNPFENSGFLSLTLHQSKQQFLVYCDGACSEVCCFRLCIVPVTVHLYNCTSVPVYVDIDTQAGHGRSVVMTVMLFSSVIVTIVVPFELWLYFW